MADYLLEVDHLSLTFDRWAKWLKRKEVKPVADLSLKVKKGEIMAVAGSSGSGKSLLASAVLGILPDNCRLSGTIKYDGEPLTKSRQKQLRGNAIRLIPQSVGYLNPLYAIGRQLSRAAVLSGVGINAVNEEVDKTLKRYNLDFKVKNLYPHQLSGGMARRVLTAMATVGRPKLLIADEPTTGLDPEVMNESLAYLRNLANEGCGVIIISHDLAAVLPWADWVAVFYDGVSIETFEAGHIGVDKLRHPYTKALWRALPGADFWRHLPKTKECDLKSAGCSFAARCDLESRACSQSWPLNSGETREYVRCHHA